MILLLKNLLFLLVVPTLELGWLPLRVFERHPQLPEVWRWPQLAALLLFGVGVLAYLHCVWLFMWRGQGTPAPLDPPHKLIQRGLYRWTRNPMYLAKAMILGGEALFFQSMHIAIYLLCAVCVYHLIVMLAEESALTFRFGAMYEDYKRAVPRWIPRRPRPRLELE